MLNYCVSPQLHTQMAHMCSVFVSARAVNVLQIVVEPGDLLVAINGKKLSGNKFGFEDAIGQCSRAPVPRWGVDTFGATKTTNPRYHG